MSIELEKERTNTNNLNANDGLVEKAIFSSQYKNVYATISFFWVKMQFWYQKI